MEVHARHNAHFGKWLFASNETIKFVGTPWFGIGIVHFSLCGDDNIFYVQPEDGGYFRTDDDWRLRDGGRLRLPAEDQHGAYCPDKEATLYAMLDCGVQLKQQQDERHNLILWNATSANDKRVASKQETVGIRQPALDEYFKPGTFLGKGEAVYMTEQQVFRKCFPMHINNSHPDGNANLSFSCANI